MLRSMFAGVAGLRSHQTMLDVTSNNLANVNTTGYKASRTTFQDTLYQTVRGGTGGVLATNGGVNPLQLGLGVSVGSVDGVFSQGSSQITNRGTDVAIQGEGFFVVQGTNGGQMFTRAGSFGWDSAGNFVTPNGDLVVGWNGSAPPDATAPNTAGASGPISVAPADLANISDVGIAADGTITGRDDTGTVVYLGTIALATFMNVGGLNRVGETMFAASPASGAPDIGAAGTAARGDMQGGALEMSNVDISQEFTQLIMAQRGFQANARTITTSDEILQEVVNIKR
ncbi:MAG TPA: flagellar hook-basal body complex protein [Euzebyales bacterium]|nr:flagellar hook-basal body complex protein [Euzebyales bacterium]